MGAWLQPPVLYLGGEALAIEHRTLTIVEFDQMEGLTYKVCNQGLTVSKTATGSVLFITKLRSWNQGLKRGDYPFRNDLVGLLVFGIIFPGSMAHAIFRFACRDRKTSRSYSH